MADSVVKIKNIIAALRDQMPLGRLIRNLRRGHIRGLIHPRSHYTFDGTEKISYSSKAKAQKAAASMQRKYGHYYSNYKCIRCDGYHIGKNQKVE